MIIDETKCMLNIIKYTTIKLAKKRSKVQIIKMENSFANLKELLDIKINRLKHIVNHSPRNYEKLFILTEY